VNARRRQLVVSALLAAAFGATACSSSNPTQPTTTTAAPTPTPTASPQVAISAPVPVSPSSGATTNGWPTFTVNDASHTGTVGTLVYRFDVSTSAAFTPIFVTATVSETPNQTSFTPPSNTAAPPQTALFWRATAVDQSSGVSSPASAAQSFTFSVPPSVAATLSLQEGVPLWPAAQPPGASGHATLGNFWQVGMLTSFTGVSFLSPLTDELRVFDLMDRGFDPQGAIDWLHANGYATNAAYYPSIAVIGFPYEYMALVNGRWDLVLRVGG
jgi:hypothetical protein